jgi:hypothetical protein
MKWHKEITSKKNPVYSVYKAKCLRKTRRPRTLSRWKQENIRIALKRKMSLNEIHLAVGGWCGFCFDVEWNNCHKCPLHKRVGKNCFALSEHGEIEDAETHEEFAKAHKAWCKKLGLWGKGWE